MPTEVIIADDLTGAMDTGVFLAEKYSGVSVLFDKSHIEEMVRDNEALIINTESRNIPSESAYSVMRGYAEYLSRANTRLIYKKIDSTLRGNIGKELEAILDAGTFDMIVLAPALPLAGRTTLSGTHYLNGRPLTESDIASDPLSPVRSSCIPDILKEQTAMDTSVVALPDIRAGQTRLAEALNRLRGNGCRIAVLDAQNEEDLDTIAKALDSSSPGILPCGSAGLLSRMYASRRPDNGVITDKRPDNGAYIAGSPDGKADSRKPAKDKPLVVLSGSPAKMSKLQIDRTQERGEFVIRLDGDKVIARDMAPVEIVRVKELAFQALGAGRNLVIDAAGPSKKKLGELYSGKPEKLREASEKIQDAVADIAEVIAENADISGMLIFGGETALGICRRLGAKALRILGEVEPLVPYGAFVGGRLDGTYVATKAGGFGSEDIILNAVRHFRE